MIEIEWSDIAFEDLGSIRDYIAKDAPFYARQFIAKLMSATDKLASFPEIGRMVPEAEETNIRELIFHSYRIIYRVSMKEKYILIITVVHGSRDLTQQDEQPWDVV